VLVLVLDSLARP